MAGRVKARAVVNDLSGRPWHCETWIVRQGPERFTMYAPGWRPMAFRTLERAMYKLECHPGFVDWTLLPG